MLKKILTIIALLCPFAAVAQTNVGDWRIHPFFVGSLISNMIDTGDQVYYLTGGDLFCFDKATEETQSYNKCNYLSDVSVKAIYYNYQKRYLVVTYDNANIDVIDEDGAVTNMPDIKDATLTHDKTINDITFADGMMLAATQFGYVLFDDTKMQVKESRIYGTAISSMTYLGDWMVVAVDGELRAARKGTHAESFSSFKALGGDVPHLVDARLLAVKNDALIVNADCGMMACRMNTVGEELTLEEVTRLTTVRATTIQPTTMGYIASFYANGDAYIMLDANAENPARVQAAPELYSAAPGGDGKLWALGDKGLHLASDQQNYYKPDGINIAVGAFYMAYSEGQKRLYLSSASDNLLADWGSALGATTQICAYDGFNWSDVTPDNLPGDGISANWQMVIDPKDNNTYVYPSRKYGVVKVTNDKIVNVYNETNSHFASSSFYKGACAFDAEGNLWVVYSATAASADEARNVAVLPRAKYEQSSVKASDWITVSVPATKQGAFKGSTFVIANGVKVFSSGGYQKPLVFWHESGGLSSTPSRASYVSLMDQDGKSITWNNVYCMESDHHGTVWVGFDNGIISLDPTRAFDGDFVINHIKVPRNDGTGLADYLLDGTQINCIAVDGANRKWIGTHSSGLFLVSPDGSQVLRQFTQENSPITSNTIYSVCCNPTNNSVYVVTSNSFMEYFSDTAPGTADYSNIQVYPNPVRPDFMGMITITGLMDNSLVKIADAAGHVVKQLKSVGGMATWDGCNDKGDRVSTGVYYVLASEKQGGTAHAKVAKFLIVR